MQSLTTYLKRVTLLALLAVLGYGIGTALQPGESSLQAKTACNGDWCAVGFCWAREEENTGQNCDSYLDENKMHRCKEVPCGG